MSDADDFFDDLTTDDDDDDPGKKTGGDDDPKNDTDPDDPLKPSLEEQLAEKDKEIAGLKSATVKYRQGQARLRGEVDEIKAQLAKKDDILSIVEEGLSKRKALKDGGDNDNDDPYKDLKELDAKVNEDGNVVVPADKLVEILKKQDEKVDDVKKQLSAEEQKKAAKEAYENHVNSLLSGNENYPKAYDTLKKAATGIEQAVQLRLKARNLKSETKVTPGQALDLLTGSDELKEFREKFPQVDPDILVRAFDSDFDFTRALDQIIDRTLGSTKDDDDIFAKIKDKPSNLQGANNQKKETGGVLDRAARLSADVILDMDDDTAERIEKEMERQAKEADL